MSEELDKLLNDSTGIVIAIDELRNELPKIQKSKEQIDKQIKDFKKLKDDINKNVDEKKDEILKIENNINSVQEKIDKSLSTYGSLKSYIEDLDEVKSKIEKLEEEQKKIISAIKILQNKKSNADTEIPNNFMDLVADYAQPHDIQYLFNKYRNSRPVIIRRIMPIWDLEKSDKPSKPWSNDYCFWVKNIQNNQAQGYYYDSGKKLNNNMRAPAINKVEYVLYCNNEKIKEIIESEKANKG